MELQSIRVDLLGRLQRAHQTHPVPNLKHKLSNDVQPEQGIERVPFVVYPFHSGRVVESLQQDGHKQVAQQADAEDHETEKVGHGADAVRARPVRASDWILIHVLTRPEDILKRRDPISRQRHEQEPHGVTPVLKVGIRRESVAFVRSVDLAVQRAAEAGVDVHEQEHQTEDVEHGRERGEERVNEGPQPRG